MKMYPDDWRIRVFAAVMGGASMGAAMFFGPRLGVDGLLPGGLTIIVSIVLGIVLGNHVGRLLFKPSSGESSDPPRRE